jgi:predicted component of type VI protein secretion system
MILTLLAVSLNEQALSQPITAHFDSRGGTMGRADHNTMALPDPERHVSRMQAEIIAGSGGFLIRNVGTANPVVVSGRVVAPGESTGLAHGDEIRVGGYLLQVESRSDDAAREITRGRAILSVSPSARLVPAPSPAPTSPPPPPPPRSAWMRRPCAASAPAAIHLPACWVRRLRSHKNWMRLPKRPSKRPSKRLRRRPRRPWLGRLPQPSLHSKTTHLPIWRRRPQASHQPRSACPRTSTPLHHRPNLREWARQRLFLLLVRWTCSTI